MIGEWWIYRPADFLLFSLRVYERQFELANNDWWLFQLVVLALGLAEVWKIRRQAPTAIFFLALFVAASLVASAKIFMLDQYAAINWLADELAMLFFIEGGAILIATITLRASSRANTISRTRLLAAFSLYLLIGYPVVTAMIKQQWAAYEAIAVAPDPTAVAALLVAGMFQPYLAITLSIIPLAWIAFSLMTLWTLESPTFWLLALTTILAGGLILRHHTLRN